MEVGLQSLTLGREGTIRCGQENSLRCIRQPGSAENLTVLAALPLVSQTSTVCGAITCFGA